MRQKRYNLMRAMAAAGVKSASAFARSLDINQTIVSGWINGSLNPNEGQAQRVADALMWENSLEELFAMGSE